MKGLWYLKKKDMSKADNNTYIVYLPADTPPAVMPTSTQLSFNSITTANGSDFDITSLSIRFLQEMLSCTLETHWLVPEGGWTDGGPLGYVCIFGAKWEKPFLIQTECKLWQILVITPLSKGPFAVFLLSWGVDLFVSSFYFPRASGGYQRPGPQIKSNIIYQSLILCASGPAHGYPRWRSSWEMWLGRKWTRQWKFWSREWLCIPNSKM